MSLRDRIVTARELAEMFPEGNDPLRIWRQHLMSWRLTGVIKAKHNDDDGFNYSMNAILIIMLKERTPFPSKIREKHWQMLKRLIQDVNSESDFIKKEINE